jgi:hypothetical protein
MADSRISELPQAAAVFSEDEFIVNNDPAGAAETKKVTLQQMLAGPRRTFSMSGFTFSILASDRTVVQIADPVLTGFVTLPAANTVPLSSRITLMDESGAVGPTAFMAVVPVVGDEINSATVDIMNKAHAYRVYESNGINKWTVMGASEDFFAGLLARVAALETTVAQLVDDMLDHEHPGLYDDIGTATFAVSNHAGLSNPHLGSAAAVHTHPFTEITGVAVDGQLPAIITRDTELLTVAGGIMTTHEAAADPHPQYVQE